MKKLIIASIISLLYCSAFSQDKLEISGELSSDNRFLYQSNYPWSWNENRLDLKMDQRLGNFAKFQGNIWMRSFGHPETNNLITSPDIREAYVEVYDFLLKGLDLRAGRQIIKWGTADQLNPTNNINPYDLEDLWDFGRQLGNEALQLRYYKNDWRLEFVYLPNFRKARLPLGGLADALMPDIAFPSSMQVSMSDTMPPIDFPLTMNNLLTHERMPDYNLKSQSSAGFRLSRPILNTDVSVSYLFTRDGLPTIGNAYINLDSLNLLEGNTYISADVDLIFPRYHIFGLDAAGTIGNVGVWGEVAVFLPDQQYVMQTHLPNVNKYILDNYGFDMGIPQPNYPDSVIIDNKQWMKYVFGLDYTFTDGTYTNFQYMRGFLHERGCDELNDYFMLRTEKKILNEKLTIALLSGGFAVNDWKNFESNNAFIWMPEIGYKPNDNTQIIIGSRIIDGAGKGMFAKIKDRDEFYFRISYMF